MFALRWSMAFAALVSAEQITTTFWIPYSGTNKYSFYGSVVGADNQRLTLQLEYANGTDRTALFFKSGNIGTYTVAPTLQEHAGTATVMDFRDDGVTSSSLYPYSIRCEKPNTASDARATCVEKDAPGLASAFYCNLPANPTYASGKAPVDTEVITHTHGSGIWGPAGVETFTQTYQQNERVPWCDDPSASLSSFASTYQISSDSLFTLGTFQVVITAGEEKLSATTGAGVSTGSVTPTGTAANTATKNTGSTPTGGAAGVSVPMKTAAPALAGVGALAAAFFL
jgi:hypothetical protein